MCQQHTHIHATTVMRVRELLRGALQSGGDGHVWRTQTNRYRERESSGDPTVTTCCREASQNSNATLHTRGAVHCIPVAPTICSAKGSKARLRSIKNAVWDPKVGEGGGGGRHHRVSSWSHCDASGARASTEPVRMSGNTFAARAGGPSLLTTSSPANTRPYLGCQSPASHT